MRPFLIKFGGHAQRWKRYNMLYYFFPAAIPFKTSEILDWARVNKTSDNTMSVRWPTECNFIYNAEDWRGDCCCRVSSNERSAWNISHKRRNWRASRRCDCGRGWRDGSSGRTCTDNKSRRTLQIRRWWLYHARFLLSPDASAWNSEVKQKSNWAGTRRGKSQLSQITSTAEPCTCNSVDETLNLTWKNPQNFNKCVYTISAGEFVLEWHWHGSGQGIFYSVPRSSINCSHAPQYQCLRNI